MTKRKQLLVSVTGHFSKFLKRNLDVHYNLIRIFFMIFMKRNVLIMDCALFGMCSKWNVPLNVLFLECDQNIMYPFWNVIKMKCAQNRMCSKRNLLFLECDQNGMGSKRNGLFLECDQNGMGSKWNVSFLECEQNEMWSKKECDHFWSNACNCQKGLLKLTLFLPSLKFQYHP